MHIFHVSFLLKSSSTSSFFSVVYYLYVDAWRNEFAGVIYWQAENGCLQTVLRKGSAPFESYYLPVSGKVSSEAANFPLEPLQPNSSYGGKLDGPWTYFILDIPRGAAGGNLHIHLTSEVKIRYEIYARFGGWPSVDSWDYYYANKTRNSDGSMFFKLYNSSEEKVDFYILFIKEGTWTFGLRYLNAISTASKDQTTMSVSLERCPKRCSLHGDCKLALDASGLTSYRFYFLPYPTIFSYLLSWNFRTFIC